MNAPGPAKAPLPYRSPPNPHYPEFWREVFVARAQWGAHADEAARYADEACDLLRARFAPP